MNTPVQIGWAQLIIFLIAVLGIGMLISAVMGLTRGSREMEIFEDENGQRYRRWRRRHRHFRAGRSIGGVVLLVVALVLLWAASLTQAYLGLTGDIKVAQVRANMITNQQHVMNVELVLYGNDGKQASDNFYEVQGDRWMVQGNIIKFASWLNLLGMHSGYKLTRLEGQYDDPNMESNSKHTVIVLNGGDDDFFKTVYKQAWSSPFVDAAYGNAVILPADGMTYNVFVSQTGLYAKPASK
ncbi:MAG TPA: hypothetical protein VFB12_04785 [Ktedonobacteraceae bacterium]|nr:hypothetical protein [Ktedonobacteraceae bacterium]